jgi:hypothetical protein
MDYNDRDKIIGVLNNILFLLLNLPLKPAIVKRPIRWGDYLTFQKVIVPSKHVKDVFDHNGGSQILRPELLVGWQ